MKESLYRNSSKDNKNGETCTTPIYTDSSAYHKEYFEQSIGDGLVSSYTYNYSDNYMGWISQNVTKGSISEKCSTIELKQQWDPITYNGETYDNEWVKRIERKVTATYELVDYVKITPIAQFLGYFDGNGHEIRNFGIYNNTWAGVGLFCKLGDDDFSGNPGGEVKNLGVKNVYVCGNTNVGALVGTIMGKGNVENCYAANVKVTSTQGKAGSLIGYAKASENVLPTITNCYADENCVVTCVSNTGNVGGLVGYAEITMKNCFSLATVYPIDYQAAGGVVGEVNPDKYSITDAYCLKDWNGNNASKSKDVTITGATEEETKEALYEDVLKLKDDDGSSIFVVNPDDPTGTPILASQLTSGVNSGTSIKLYVDRWNFVGSFGNVAQLNKNSYKNDMSAVEWDATNNNWSEKWMNIDASKGTNTMNVAEGYFVYPFPYGLLDDYSTAKEDDKGAAISNPTDGKGNYTVVERVSSFIKAESVNINKTFSGTANESGYNNAKAVWCPLSNPFDVDLYVGNTLNEQIQGGCVYVYDAIGDKWQINLSSTSNSDLQTGIKVVKPGQGFFVAANDDGSVKFQMTLDKNSTWAPDGQIRYAWITSYSAKKSEVESTEKVSYIRFNALANGVNGEAYAINNALATDGFDSRDAYKMFSTSNEDLVDPYFTVDNRTLVKNEFKSLPYTAPVSFHAEKSSKVTFTVSGVPQDMEIYVVDLADNTETLISDGTAFTFDAEQGENDNRYSVKFIKKNLSDNGIANVNDNLTIYNNNRTVYVNGADIVSIDVVNAKGQQIANYNVNATEYNFRLTEQPAGVYVVRVQTGGVKSSKIVIK